MILTKRPNAEVALGRYGLQFYEINKEDMKEIDYYFDKGSVVSGVFEYELDRFIVSLKIKSTNLNKICLIDRAYPGQTQKIVTEYSGETFTRLFAMPKFNYATKPFIFVYDSDKVLLLNIKT